MPHIRLHPMLRKYMNVVILSAHKRGGRFGSRKHRARAVGWPLTSRSATPFDKTDELIRITSSAHAVLHLRVSCFELGGRTGFGSQREHPACALILVHQHKSVLAAASGHLLA